MTIYCDTNIIWIKCFIASWSFEFSFIYNFMSLNMKSQKKYNTNILKILYDIHEVIYTYNWYIYVVMNKNKYIIQNSSWQHVMEIYIKQHTTIILKKEHHHIKLHKKLNLYVN